MTDLIYLSDNELFNAIRATAADLSEAIGENYSSVLWDAHMAYSTYLFLEMKRRIDAGFDYADDDRRSHLRARAMSL